MQGRQISVQAPPERRLAAILAAGIDDNSLLAGDDEADLRHRVGQAMNVLRSAIAEASGTIFAFAGSGLMAEFSSTTQALTCALGIQAAAAKRLADTAGSIRCRIAVTVGEVLADRQHLGGAAISLVARLERIAPPGGIVIPGALHDQLRHAVPVMADPMGQPDLQDIDEAVVVVSISAEACVAWAGRTVEAKRGRSKPIRDPRATLAVVPFRASGASKSFADTATDDFIRTLGSLATWLTVTRTPAMAIHAPIDLHRVRQTASVRYILHGSAETERDMLRLAVELNEAESGRVLWSDRFDHISSEQAALLEDATSRSARAIPPLLLQRELDRTALVRPEALRSHDLALQAFTLIMQPERHTFYVAGEMLRQAERRPGPHGSARFAQVWWHLMAISQGWSADPVGDRSAAARAAAGLDRNDPAAMALLAFIHSAVHHDHALASAMLDRVIDTAPSCGLAAGLKGLTLCWLGEPYAAIFHAEQAETMSALGPERAWRDHVTALAYYLANRYGDAARWAQVSAMHFPGLAANARVLAASLAARGHLDEANRAAQQVLAIDPGFRIEGWRRRSMLRDASRDTFAQRLRLAGLPA